MTKHTLPTQPRTQIGRKVKLLRRQGLIPASVFGKGVKSENIQVSAKDFHQAYKQVGESSLLYLETSGSPQPKPVFISEITRDPLSSLVLHVSFHQVDLKAKITAPVKLELVGESLAVKDGLGVLVQQQGEVELEALPTDMPDHLDVDISVLSAVGDSIHLSDLKLGSKLELKSDPETIIVKIEPHAKEEVVAPPAPVEGEAPAVEGETPKTEPTSEAPAE